MHKLLALAVLCLGLADTLVNAQSESYMNRSRSFPITIDMGHGQPGMEFMAQMTGRSDDDGTLFKDSKTGEFIPGVGNLQQLLAFIKKESHPHQHYHGSTEPPAKCPAIDEEMPPYQNVQCGDSTHKLTMWSEWEHCGYSSYQDKNIRRRSAFWILDVPCEAGEYQFPESRSVDSIHEHGHGHCPAYNSPAKEIKIPLRNLTLSQDQPCPDKLKFAGDFSDWSKSCVKGKRWRTRIVVQETECRSKYTPYCPKGCPDELSPCNPSVCDRPPLYCQEEAKNPCITKNYYKERYQLYCRVNEPHVWQCQNPDGFPFMYRRLDHTNKNYFDPIYRHTGHA